MFMKVWIPIQAPTPTHISFLYCSRCLPAIEKQLIIKNKYKSIINVEPKKPTSSPTTANIKSFCASASQLPFFTD